MLSIDVFHDMQNVSH